jgi:secondary thiamine-phosphate synthase enzyme
MVSTKKQTEFIDITGELERALRDLKVGDGVLHVFNPHTTAGITVNEGADPAVQSDILGVLNRVIPENYPYRHAEGNSPAHVKASLLGSSVTVFIEGGRLALGTWQRIFFCEFDGARTRKIHWAVLS